MSIDQFDTVPEGYEIAPWQDLAVELDGLPEVIRVDAEIADVKLRKYFWKQWVTRSVDTWKDAYKDMMPLREYIGMAG